MTVGDLIKALQGIDPLKEVIMEGCDCQNPVGSVYEYEDEGDMTVLLMIDDA